MPQNVIWSIAKNYQLGGIISLEGLVIKDIKLSYNRGENNVRSK